MPFLDLVNKRKSTRRYSPQKISRETIDRCIEAARLAPSACNSQPWRFIVVDDEGLKNDLADKAFSGVYSLNTFAKSAPVLIVVVTEPSAYAARVGGYIMGIKYNLIDIGIACEHLILQAEQEALGTCWLGWFNEKAVKKILMLRPYEKVDVIISMGHPKEDVDNRAKTRKPLDAIRKFNMEFGTFVPNS